MSVNEFLIINYPYHIGIYILSVCFEFSDTVIVQVSATDADKTSRNSDLDYFIISGSLDKFSIDSSTGDMYVKPSAELDRENVDFYSIIVYAIDHGSPPLTGTTMVNVTVLDVNDVSPRFNHSSYNVTVKENQNSSNAVTCFAYDVDEDHSLYFNITHVTATNESGNNVESLLVAVSSFVVSVVKMTMHVLDFPPFLQGR